MERIKYDNSMYTTKLPMEEEYDELDYIDMVEEPYEEEIEYPSFLAEEDKAIEKIIKQGSE